MQFLGDKTDAVLYRLLKTGLRDPQMSKDVQLIDFDESSFQDRDDLDAVFMERLHAYAHNLGDDNDAYWQHIVSTLLEQKVGMRFIENGRHFYVFPTCVFVSATASQEVGKDNPVVTKGKGGMLNRDAYKENLKYDYDDEDVRKRLDERRRENKRDKRMRTAVHFYGFGIHVNDGVGIEAATSKLRGGADIDDTTYYRYIKLTQVSQSIDTGESVVKLADTTDLKTRCESAIAMLRGQIEKLFENDRTNHVRVEAGDPSSTNSMMFNVKFDRSKQYTKYDKDHRKFYHQRAKDAKEHFDLPKIIKEQVRKDDLVRYLMARGDFVRQKRIVLRYFHNRHKEHRYLIYAFDLVNGNASKMSGNIQKDTAMFFPTAIADPIISVYALRETGAEYWLTPDVGQAVGADGKHVAFDPQRVVPKLVVPDDDLDDSSATDEGSTGDNVPEANQSTLVQEFKSIANSSNVLQFLSLLVLEVTKRRSSVGWFSGSSSTATAANADGTYRNQFKSRNFAATRENLTEPFRFNTSYLFVNLLLCASHHVQALTYGRASVRKHWFSKDTRTGYLYNVIHGANNVRGAGGGLFHDNPTVTGNGGLSDAFLAVFTKDLSGGSFLFGSRKSFKRNQPSQLTAYYLVENIRQFYKDKLQSLTFHLHDRDDPDEFFFHLRRRNFWDMYSRRIKLVHAPFYKEVVAQSFHDTFLRQLFYYQLKRVVVPESPQQEGASKARTLPVGMDNRRVPTFYTDEKDFNDLLTDAHRTMLTLKTLRFENETTQYVYSLNLLKQYGEHTKASEYINLASSRNKTATDELVEMLNENDTVYLEAEITKLMKTYKIQDKLTLLDLQRNTTRLLFHFLHFVENNGTLDPLGNLNVTYGLVHELRKLLSNALRVDKKDDGSFMPKASFFSFKFFRSGTSDRAIADQLFSMSPYLKLTKDVLRRMSRYNGFRMMLQNWSLHGNLFWNIVDFDARSSFFARRLGLTTKDSDLHDVESFSLYVFLPSYLYLTREIRNLAPYLQDAARGTMQSILETQEALNDKDPRSVYKSKGGIDRVVRGLLFGIKQELLQTSETNVFIVHVKRRATASNKSPDTYWLFGHWRRQYVLYDLGGNVVETEAGLRFIHTDPRVLGEDNRVPNLLDDKLRESSKRMLDIVRDWRNEVESRTEDRTTVKHQHARRQSMRTRRNSIAKKVDKFEAVYGDNALADYQAPETITDGVVKQTEKVFVFIKILQALALHKKLHTKPMTQAEQSTAKQLVNAKPYQDNAMCAIMWLVFRDLYTFLPGMYNHVMMAVNDRLRHCEMGLMLHSGGVLPGGALVMRKEPLALTEAGYKYYVKSATEEDGSSKHNQDYPDDRSYLITLSGKMHDNDTNASINRRLMFQLLLTNLAQLGATEDLAAGFHDTEPADVRVMSWAQYVAEKEVTDKLQDTKTKMLVFSALLNGVFACNAVMSLTRWTGLRTVMGLFFPSGVLSTTMSVAGTFAKLLVPVLWRVGLTAVTSPLMQGIALGSLAGGFGGLFDTLSKAVSSVTSDIGKGTGVWQAVCNLFTGAASSVKDTVTEKVGDKVKDVSGTIAAYLVTNIRMYRVKTYFLHNGHKYEWQFDLGVDRETGMILMYHGLLNDDKQKVTAYRDINVDTDDTLQRIRTHKHKHSNRRRSRRKSDTVANRQPHTRRARLRERRLQRRGRQSRRRH